MRRAAMWRWRSGVVAEGDASVSCGVLWALVCAGLGVCWAGCAGSAPGPAERDDTILAAHMRAMSAHDAERVGAAWRALRAPGALDAYMASLERVFQGPCAAQDLARYRAELEAALDSDRPVHPSITPCAWDTATHAPLAAVVVDHGEDRVVSGGLPEVPEGVWRVHVVLQVHASPFSYDASAPEASGGVRFLSVDACQRRIVSTILSTPARSARFVIQEGLMWRTTTAGDGASDVLRLLGPPSAPRWVPFATAPLDNTEALRQMYGAVWMWGLEQPLTYKTVLDALVWQTTVYPNQDTSDMDPQQRARFHTTLKRNHAIERTGQDVRDASALLQALLAASASPDRTSWVILGYAHGPNLLAKIARIQAELGDVEFVVHPCVDGLGD